MSNSKTQVIDSRKKNLSAFSMGATVFLGVTFSASFYYSHNRISAEHVNPTTSMVRNGKTVNSAINHLEEDSVALMVRRNKLTPLKNTGNKQLVTNGKTCKGVPVPAGGSCSGVLVAKDVVATVGHCLGGKRAKEWSFVFDYRQQNIAPNSKIVIEDKNIYHGKKIIGRVYNIFANHKTDWALVQLDRQVNNHRPVEIASDEFTEGAKVHVIGHPLGHPLGLPFTISPDAEIKCDDKLANAFSINLAVFDGNSGSPIFNEQHKMIGMVSHVRRGKANCQKPALPSCDKQKKPCQCPYPVGVRTTQFSHRLENYLLP